MPRGRRRTPTRSCGRRRRPARRPSRGPRGAAGSRGTRRWPGRARGAWLGASTGTCGMSLPACHESATLLRAMTAPVSPTAARIGVVSDVHVTPDVDRTGRWNELIHYDRALPRLAMALEWFEEEDVDAILVLGDLTEDGDQESLSQALDAVQDKVDRATYVFAGNHDGAVLGELSQQVDARPPLALVPDGIVRGVPLGTAHIDWHGGYRFTAQLEAPETDDLLIVATHFPLISRVRAIEAR